jgi:sugar phosphate isomerase/epimerase
MEKARDKEYLQEMKKRCTDNGVRSLLIMCDNEGRIGDPDNPKRQQAVENHYKWAEAAEFLGCHSIRVNGGSEGSYEEQQKLAADGLRKLTEFGATLNLNVIVENHGGLSSNGKWLSGVMNLVDHPRCGTLPDFGNFRVSETETYDRYQGVQELMPYAKAVSAKSGDFDEQGNETRTDFLKMMRIVLASGYRGYVGIEYGGDKISEGEGIRKTLELLKKVREILEAENKKAENKK